MPSIAYTSKIRASSEDWSLALIIRHLLVIGQPSETVREMKASLPNTVDVHLDSQLRINVSGLLNGDKISPPVLQESCIARHLVEFLRLNANELGIAVSDLRISQDTELLTFICASSRPFQPVRDRNPCRTILVGLNLTYIWKTSPGVSDDHVRYPQLVASMNPFSCKQLSLSYLTAVNGIVQKFVIFQLVKRYPLIFGSWAQQLDIETPFTASIHKSLSRVISRSPHPKFQDTCKQLLKLSMEQVASVSLSMSDRLSVYLETEGPIDALEPLFEELDVSTMLNNFYHFGLRRPLFKGLSISHITDDHEDFFEDSMEQNKTINPDAICFSETYQTSQPNLENIVDLEVILEQNSSRKPSFFDYLHQYPDSLLGPPCNAKKLFRKSDPEGAEVEPEYLSFLATVNCFSDAENGSGITEKAHEKKSKTFNSNHDRQELLNAYPAWSPDIDSSQEKLDRSPVGMTNGRTLPEPCLKGISPMVLDLTFSEDYTEPTDKRLETFSDSDFEDWSGSEKDAMFQFGSSPLQPDSDSRLSSNASDGHEVTSFQCMGRQGLAPLSPRPSILSEGHTSLGAIQMECEVKGGSVQGGLAIDASLDDNRFLVVEFD